MNFYTVDMSASEIYRAYVLRILQQFGLTDEEVKSL